MGFNISNFQFLILHVGSVCVEKIMTVLLIFVVLNCSMARYNGRLHCIVGVLPTCYKRKAATNFYPPGGMGPYYYKIFRISGKKIQL